MRIGLPLAGTRRRTPDFKLYQGWNEAKMIMPAKMFSAMGVWTSLEPQLTTPTPSHSPREGGEPTEFAALYRIEFLEDGLRSIHREGPRRAMPH
jgi:hypothetical protein